MRAAILLACACWTSPVTAPVAVAPPPASTGCTISETDLHAWRARLAIGERLFADVALRDRLGAGALAVRELYSSDAIVRQWETLIDEVVT